MEEFQKVYERNWIQLDAVITPKFIYIKSKIKYENSKRIRNPCLCCYTLCKFRDDSLCVEIITHTLLIHCSAFGVGLFTVLAIRLEFAPNSKLCTHYSRGSPYQVVETPFSLSKYTKDNSVHMYDDVLVKLDKRLVSSLLQLFEKKTTQYVTNRRLKLTEPAKSEM